MYVNMPVPWSVDMGHGTGTPWLATSRSSKIDWEGQPTRVTRAPGAMTHSLAWHGYTGITQSMSTYFHLHLLKPLSREKRLAL